MIAKHDMPNISFASNGDGDLSEYVAYVAKDHAHKRSCFVLQCEGGLAHNVINSIGQAFELRFKEFMKRTPRPAAKTAAPAPAGRPELERDYYNDLPGKMIEKTSPKNILSVQVHKTDPSPPPPPPPPALLALFSY